MSGGDGDNFIGPMLAGFRMVFAVCCVGGWRWLWGLSGSGCCDERHSVLVCVSTTWCVTSVWLLYGRVLVDKSA